MEKTSQKLTPQRLAELRAMPEPCEAVLKAIAEKMMKKGVV